MADFHTDKASINHIVHHSRSEKEARKNYKGLHGISVPRHTADRIFDDAVKRNFSKQESQASYTSIIAQHYEITAGEEEFTVYIEVYRKGDVIFVCCAKEDDIITEFFPQEYVDQIGDEANPTELEVELKYDFDSGQRQTQIDPSYPADVTLNSAQLVFKGRKLPFDDILAIEEFHDSWKETILDETLEARKDAGENPTQAGFKDRIKGILKNKQLHG